MGSRLFLLWTFILFAFIEILKAQDQPCGTSHKDQSVMLEMAQKSSQLTYKKEGGFIFLPIQVHMLLNDQGNGLYNLISLDESLCTLNKDFEQTGFQFYMENEINFIKNGEWDNHTEFHAGIEMMQTNNVDNVINCYIVTNPAGTCGYFAWDGNAVALSKSCLGKASHTWAHELGHFFSLPHTFFGWEGISYNGSQPTSAYQQRVRRPIENVNRERCQNQADGYCGTTPDYISNRWTCNQEQKTSYFLKDLNDSLFQADGSLFMSYANDRCMSRFSSDQSEAMVQFLHSNRSELLRSAVQPVYLSRIEKENMWPNDSSVISTSSVNFTWPEIPGADGYIFHLARNEAMTITVKFTSTQTNHISLDNLVSGRNYYWRVKPFNKFDFCQPVSDTSYFHYNTISNILDSDQTVTSIHIFPNPATDINEITIQSENVDILDASLANQLGVLEYRPLQKINNHFYKLNIEGLPKGIYFISMKTRDQIITQKLLVK
ncbi:MAG: T9SS type A sorting domain-containing protein [Saprospiraceae bacterium]|nr:T9SS type A sorting domain-containing protein [Saprospiraceae bacterium]